MGILNLGAQSSDAPLSGSAILDGSISLAELAQSLRNFLVPIGAILPYGGIGAAPSGFVYCDGSLHDVTGTCSNCGLAHADLATALSNSYGGVAGTSFRVPDLRGRIPLGAGNGTGEGATGASGSNPTGTSLTSRTRGDWGGAQVHLLTATESGIPAHVVPSAGGHTHTINNAGTHSHSASTGPAGAHEHSYTASFDQNWRFNITAVSSGGNTVNKGTYGANTSNNGNHSHSVSVDDAGDHGHSMNESGAHTHSVSAAPASSSHNNMPPYVAVNYIIKAI